MDHKGEDGSDEHGEENGKVKKTLGHVHYDVFMYDDDEKGDWVEEKEE